MCIRDRYHLGRLYFEGKGIPQNYKESYKWYLNAANNGEKNSQNALGVIFKNGLGVDKDFDKSISCFKLS